MKSTDVGYVTTARKELEAFLQVGAFRSLQFIKHSAHWAESTFWVILIIVTTVFAIRDVLKVCTEFADEATATNMQVIGLQNLTFNNAVICVNYDPHMLTRLHAKTAETFEVFDIVNEANISTLEFLQKSLNLFTALSLLEIGRSADYERKVVALLNSTADLQHLHNWLRAQTRTTATKVWRYVGAWLCLSAKLEITTFARGTHFSTIDPCDPAKITWLGVIPFVSIPSSETTFCLRIGEHISFGSILDLIVISINNEDLLKGLTAERTGDYILNSYLDLSGDPVSSDMTRDFIQFPTHGCQAVRIGIDTNLHLVNKQSARCDGRATSRLVCYGGCNWRRYEELPYPCNCTLFGWHYLYADDRRTCFDAHSIGDHIECRRLSPYLNLSNSCFQSCLFPCVLRQVGIDVVEQGCEIYSINRMNGASLELAPKQFTVTVFEEHFAVGVSELFSRIGGTCGLWLGVGLLGVCHALLFPLKVFSKLLQLRRVKEAKLAVPAVELSPQG